MLWLEHGGRGMRQGLIRHRSVESTRRALRVGRDGTMSTTVIVETDLILDTEDEDYDKAAVDSLVAAVKKFIDANANVDQVLIEAPDDDDDDDDDD
jgi:hypothetical protein